MPKEVKQKAIIESGASVGTITQIVRVGIPLLVIIAIILIALTQMTGYDLRPIIDTAIFGATPTPSLPLCRVTISPSQCLLVFDSASDDAKIHACLPNATQIQITGIADPYYEISPAGLERWIYSDAGIVVRTIEMNSPAQAAGMKMGDILLQIDDLPLDDDSVSTGPYAEQHVGTPVKIALKREGEAKTLFVTPREPIKVEGGYYPGYGPIGFTYGRSMNESMVRGYVKAYSVSQSFVSLTQTKMDVTSYVSCPTQLIQPNMFGE